MKALFAQKALYSSIPSSATGSVSLPFPPVAEPLGGMFALEPNEALVLWVTVPKTPDYLGFQLSDSWMQSLDHANYVTSRNQSQMNFDADGSSYLVVAHEDPGVRNWISTTGLEIAQMTFRFGYREEPSPASRRFVPKKSCSPISPGSSETIRCRRSAPPHGAWRSPLGKSICGFASGSTRMNRAAALGRVLVRYGAQAPGCGTREKTPMPNK